VKNERAVASLNIFIWFFLPVPCVAAAGPCPAFFEGESAWLTGQMLHYISIKVLLPVGGRVLAWVGSFFIKMLD
jgi:hypothetical protein